MERGRIILGKHTREDTNRQTKKIKATDWQKHVSRRTKWKTDPVFRSDRHDSSVSQTSKGKRRFKASVVDTSAGSPRTVSLWRQELALASQCKLHYHHRHHHYHEKWKSYWVRSKAFGRAAFYKGFTRLECGGYLFASLVIKSCKFTENILSYTNTPMLTYCARGEICRISIRAQ